MRLFLFNFTREDVGLGELDEKYNFTKIKPLFMYFYLIDEKGTSTFIFT